MDQLPSYYYYLLLALLYFLFIYTKLKSSKTKNSNLHLPPGPWQLPVIGSIHHLFGRLPHQAMRDLASKHGPLLLLKLGEVTTIVISSPDAAKEVMKTHDVVFATRPLSATTKIITNNGQSISFSPYGDYWRQLRKICIMELLSAKRVQSFRRIREEEVAKLLNTIDASSKSRSLFNLSEAMAMMVTDVTTRAVVGNRCKERDVFLRELNNGVELTAGFNLADLFPSSVFAGWLSGVVRKAEVCRDTIDALFNGIIREHLERRSGGDGDGETEDLLDVLLKIQEEGGLQFPLTMLSIKSVMLDMFSAGSETSSTTFHWAMAELMRNPKVMQRAQLEVRQAFQGQQSVDERSLGNLNYLQLVIKETLRLHAPVPLLLPRVCQSECTVLGYDVPKGTNVLVNAWAIGRDSKYWDDAEEFKPERFEGNLKDFKGTNFEFLPFGAGRRICPGMSFGLGNVELPLASVLFHFDWELPVGERPNELDMTEAFGITARRKRDLLLRPILRLPLPII